MSIFFRSGAPVEQQRSSGAWPTQLVPARYSGAGTRVDAGTAPSVVAYGAAVSLVASIGSMLPVDCWSGSGELKRPAPKPPLLTDPGGRGYGWSDWVYACMSSLLFRGNAVATIAERDGQGFPTMLVLADMDQVAVFRNDRTGVETWTVGGKEVSRQDVWHLRRSPRPGQVLGMSPIQQYANTLGLALASEQFGSQWFADGAHPTAVLQTDQQVSPDVAATLKDRVITALRGNREPLVLSNGVKLQPYQVAPEESQFLQTQQFTAAQVCRIVGPGVAEIFGYATGDSMSYKNREQVAIDLLTYTVDPYLTRLEESLSALMPKPRWFRFNRGALLRSDLVQRYTAHRIALGPNEPFQTVNEVRQLEDMPPVGWGDEKPITGAQPAVTGDMTNG